ncbi:OmpA family protein [Mesobaculum littorinae]|uniref:OmpA family protein n=1 Tax=Mesobaculum littorinae TaxID=2486419 RepID=A0A438AED2_9RHOB|nr:OmpA family protein [Mesobaculum littorinae]RVV97054.1 OmpA family protein [Mesobaculum littorinae]
MKFPSLTSAALAGFVAMTGTASVAQAQDSCLIVLPFDFNSAAVSPTNQQILEVIRQNYANSTVNLAGHSDAVGSASYNLALSERRVDTVRDYITQGTGISVVETEAFGESDLEVAVPGASQANRRVEVFFQNCDPNDFAATGATGPAGSAGFGRLNNAATLGALAGAAVIVGVLAGDDDDESTTTTTTTTTGGGGADDALD